MKEQTIQTNLRAIRGRAGLSLSQAQDLTGVSKAMLGQIERGESSPTIATLWKLARGFQLPLTDFIRDPEASDETSSVDFKNSISVETLLPFDPTLACESFLVTLAPGMQHETAAHQQGVVEDVFAVTGPIEIIHGGIWHALAPGEALRFPADGPHGYRNPTSTAQRFHNTIHYPKRNIPLD